MCVIERQPPFTSTHPMLPLHEPIAPKYERVTTLCKPQTTLQLPY